MNVKNELNSLITDIFVCDGEFKASTIMSIALLMRHGWCGTVSASTRISEVDPDIRSTILIPGKANISAEDPSQIMVLDDPVVSSYYNGKSFAATDKGFICDPALYIYRLLTVKYRLNTYKPIWIKTFIEEIRSFEECNIQENQVSLRLKGIPDSLPKLILLFNERNDEHYPSGFETAVKMVGYLLKEDYARASNLIHRRKEMLNRYKVIK